MQKKIRFFLSHILLDIQYRTKRVQPNNANLVSLYKSAAFFQFREITM